MKLGHNHARNDQLAIRWMEYTILRNSRNQQCSAATTEMLSLVCIFSHAKGVWASNGVGLECKDIKWPKGLLCILYALDIAGPELNALKVYPLTMLICLTNLN